MPPSVLDTSQLNPQQQAAVVHTNVPLLVLAGAGSGKTRVITYKIAHLINEHAIDPAHIMAVTFTNRAAREMRERAEVLCPPARWAHICTFHSYGAQFLRRYATQANLNPRFSIYDDDESLGVLSILYPHDSRAILKTIAHKISRAKNLGLLPHDDLTPIERSSHFVGYYERYQSHLREIGNMDFGDLILQPLRILRDHPEIRAEEQRRNSVLLIDEYQDTNRAQYELVQALYHKQLYLCAVGDDDQSIYRFRGADINHIINFSSHFDGSVIMRLEQNYRSTSPILALADAVVNNNRRRHPKRLWTQQSGGKLPELTIFENDFQEARYCIDKIRSDWMQIETAILYRTNAQSPRFENELIRNAIGYKIIGSVRFYNREEIKDLVAFLKFLYNPQDEVSFRRIVNKPTRGIGAATLRTINEYTTTNGDLLEAISCYITRADGTPKAKAGAQQIIDICKKAHTFLQRNNSRKEEEADVDSQVNLGELVQLISEESGLREYHHNQDADTNGPREQNIAELVRTTARFACSYDGLYNFLESVELESGEHSVRSSTHADHYVTLITMHNTKGLEFERVFIVGLQDGLFPRLTENNLDEIEEERRLLYVAITRAKRELLLTSYRIRHVYGRAQENSLTRFLEEVPEEHFRRIDYSSPDYSNNFYHQQSPFQTSQEYDQSSPDRSLPEGEARFALGDHVYHDDYGPGIISKRTLEHERVLVTVRFQNGRIAHFIERYAALDKIAAEEG